MQTPGGKAPRNWVRVKRAVLAPKRASRTMVRRYSPGSSISEGVKVRRAMPEASVAEAMEPIEPAPETMRQFTVWPAAGEPEASSTWAATVLGSRSSTRIPLPSAAEMPGWMNSLTMPRRKRAGAAVVSAEASTVSVPGAAGVKTVVEAMPSELAVAVSELKAASGFEVEKRMRAPAAGRPRASRARRVSGAETERARSVWAGFNAVSEAAGAPREGGSTRIEEGGKGRRAPGSLTRPVSRLMRRSLPLSAA
jgi:hypothetical protein